MSGNFDAARPFLEENNLLSKATGSVNIKIGSGHNFIGYWRQSELVGVPYSFERRQQSEIGDGVGVGE